MTTKARFRQTFRKWKLEQGR